MDYSQNVPKSKRPLVKTSPNRSKRPKNWSKRPHGKKCWSKRPKNDFLSVADLGGVLWVLQHPQLSPW